MNTKIPYEVRDTFLPTLIDEVHVELRYRKSQTYFVVKVEEDQDYWDYSVEDVVKVPSKYHGYWRTRFPTDNEYTPYSSAWYDKYEDWVRCEKREVVMVDWEVL